MPHLQSYKKTSWLRLPLGGARHFYRLLVVPQIFVFVLLLVLGRITVEPFQAVVVKLAAICFVLLSSFVIARPGRRVTSGTLLVHIGGLVALLVGLSLALALDPFTSVFLPTALVILCLAFFVVPGSTLLVIYCIVGALLFAFCLALLFFLDWSLAASASGWFLVLFCSLMVLLRSVVGGYDRHIAEASVIDGAKRGKTQSDAAAAAHEPQSHLHDREALMDVFRQILFVEAGSEVISRCVGLAVLSGLFVFGIGHAFEAGKSFAGLWLLLAFVQIALHYRLLRQHTNSRIYLGALAICIASLAWWALLAFGHRGEAVSSLLLVFVMMGIGSIPWPWRFNVYITVCFLGLFLQQLLSNEPNGFFLAAYGCALLLAHRTAVINHLNVVARAAVLFLGRYCEASSFAISSIRVLAWQSTLIGACERALIVYSGGTSEVLRDARPEVVDVDARFAQALAASVRESGHYEGILQSDRLGRQFLSPFIDWFHSVPRRLFYLRLTAVIEGREQEVFVLIPVSIGARCAGVHRTLRALVSISSIVRSSLSAAHSRFISTDTLRAAERSVVLRDRELTHVVHSVNNAVQELTIGCDGLRDMAASADVNKQPNAVSILQRIGELDQSARLLSFTVSDVKLSRELLQLRRAGALETVPLAAQIEEFIEYASCRSKRRGYDLSVRLEVDRNIAVNVAGREYFGTALRAMLSDAESCLSNGGAVVVETVRCRDVVQISVSDDGRAIGLESQEAQELGGEHVGVEEFNRRVAVQFGLLSGGKLECESSSEGGINRRKLTLVLGKIEPLEKKQASGWALFVDDSEQVVTFYHRVAEALELEHATATSAEAARSLLEERGRPRIMITDLQLGDESGIDLVHLVRKKYGNGVPIIVVSGNIDNEVVQRLESLGAARYLAKPIGRRKLFEEIERVLFKRG